MKKIVTLISLLIGIIILTGCGQQPVNQTQQNIVSKNISAPGACVLATCHGLDIQCGSKPADVCTGMYGLGDKCLKYAKCGIQDSKCQQIENSEFTQCKTCVQKCINDNKNGDTKAFDCENNC